MSELEIPTPTEALELAREVSNGQTRSYVRAAMLLANYVKANTMGGDMTLEEEILNLKDQRDDLQRKCTEQLIELRALRAGKSKLNAQVSAFMFAFDQPVRDRPGWPAWPLIRLRTELILEEAFEFARAIFTGHGVSGSAIADLHDKTIEHIRNGKIILSELDLVAAADALADLDYVVEGARLTFGIGGDPIANEVHATNMLKVGGPLDPATGKKLKPPGWKPPDIASLLRKQGWED